ncbi:MAG: hypothetical protein HYY86_01340 [Candidatus Harrisonbacteria bacterium]|nr:hypothetical protein [Candidatus Harrisonbacteria bacterium]
MAEIKKTAKRLNFKNPRLRRDAHEFPGGGKGLVICEKCDIFYYQKSWHHNADAFIAKRENKDLPVKFAVCPACQMIKNRQYEGEVIIRNVPEKLKNEVINLANAYCDRAFLKDPLDRLAAIGFVGSDISVRVTENQLANKLGKKIKDAFNKVKTKTSFQKSPGDVARVIVEFLEK